MPMLKGKAERPGCKRRREGGREIFSLAVFFVFNGRCSLGPFRSGPEPLTD